MRIAISHETVYHYERPAGGVIQTLRLTPRNHVGQYVVSWRIDVSENCLLHQQEDAFGNIVHVLSADSPLDDLRISVEGEVETQDMNGMVHGAIERFPPSLYLRETPLTSPDAALADFARGIRRAGDEAPLSMLHRLLEQAHERVQYEDGPTNATTTAAEAFALGRGVSQDMTHVFVAVARSLGIPARYIGGHLHRPGDESGEETGHAWAEAFVSGLGWIAFDTASKLCATDAHIRVAVGLDYLDAAPVRGSRTGGGTETMTVSVDVQPRDVASGLSQTQSQG